MEQLQRGHAYLFDNACFVGMVQALYIAEEENSLAATLDDGEVRQGTCDGRGLNFFAMDFQMIVRCIDDKVLRASIRIVDAFLND